MGGLNIVEGFQKFTRAFTSLVRDDDNHLEKSIRMDNMAWSLEDFEKLCSGRYNAGSLKIGRKGRLDIVNNHVDKLTILNGKSVDATDSFAIRRAFANALEESGLNKQQMNEVRARLGLRRDNNTWSTGACFTPLRRQEVREIIDKYIDDLNKDRPEERRFVTQAQMHWLWGLDGEDRHSIKTLRDTINESTKQNVEIPFDADMLCTLDLLSTHDFSDRSILSDDALHDTALLFEDLEDRVEELANQTKEDLQIWRHENPGKTFYVPIGKDCFLSLDPKTQKVLFTARGTKADSKMVTFSTGLKPKTMLRAIRSANERLHAEGARRGLNLAGKEFVDGKNVGDDSIKELPKSVRKNKIDIVEEPKREAKIEINNARKNLNTLATLIARQLQVDSDSVADIIKKVEGWEDKLSKCSTAGNPDTIDDINNDLHNFLFENRATIEPLLKEVPIAMGEKYDS